MFADDTTLSALPTKPVRKPRAKKPAPLPQEMTAALPAVKVQAPQSIELKRWAYAGVAGTLSLSAWLNGLAFSHTAPTPVHGWVLGLTIPFLILVFSRVSALLWARNRAQLAACGAVACLSMLALSVQHCAASISRMTGEPLSLAALMALAIDAGLVVCELATVSKK